MDKTIKLLNDELWYQEDLLREMVNDDFYYNYLGQHALSSSSAKKLLESPYSYHKSLTEKQTNVQPLRDGSLIHLMVLEPHRVEGLTFTKGTKASKVFKEAVAEFGQENVFTEIEYNFCSQIAERVLQNKEIADMLRGAEFEIPAIDNYKGIPFRGKADILKDGIVYDLKTTGDITKFRKSTEIYSYDLQCALYLKLFDAKDFVFIVVDKKTLDLGVFNVSEEFINSGKRKLDLAIESYLEYLKQKKNIDQHVIKGIL
tara:strand:- start:623 stop:1396 length:774 start_codon:yes stop_codon:yes gene_type:complete